VEVVDLQKDGPDPVTRKYVMIASGPVDIVQLVRIQDIKFIMVKNVNAVYFK